MDRRPTVARPMAGLIAEAGSCVPPCSCEPQSRLVAAARRDPRAFAPLYRVHAPAVYRYFSHQVRHREEAEDLTALTFRKALEALPRYEERGAFAAWLFGIARNTLRDHRRRQHARGPHVPVESLALDLVDPAPEPESQVVQREQARLLHRLVRQLPPGQRDALTLRFFGGLRPTEIALVLGRSEGAVKLLVHRAIVRLREAYDREVLP